MSLPEDPSPVASIDERVKALRLKLLDDAEILAGAIFIPDDETDREAVLMVAEALLAVVQSFVELR